MDYHGEFYFYTDHKGISYQYSAKFTDGDLEAIIVLEGPEHQEDINVPSV